MRARPAAIETGGLVKTYPGGVRALDGLTFAVPRGMIFGLLGPNGAGKSTAIKILTTLSRPDSGEARVAGFDVLSQPQQVRHPPPLLDQHGDEIRRELAERGLLGAAARAGAS